MGQGVGEGGGDQLEMTESLLWYSHLYLLSPPCESSAYSKNKFNMGRQVEEGEIPIPTKLSHKITKKKKTLKIHT